MGLLSFIREAGEKLFKSKDAETAAAEVAQALEDKGAKARIEAANQAAGDAIEAYIKQQSLVITALTITLDSATATASAFGVAADQVTREKTPLCAANVENVVSVKDMKIFEDNKPMLTHSDKIYPGQVLCIPPQ